MFVEVKRKNICSDMFIFSASTHQTRSCIFRKHPLLFLQPLPFSKTCFLLLSCLFSLTRLLVFFCAQTVNLHNQKRLYRSNHFSSLFIYFYPQSASLCFGRNIPFILGSTAGSYFSVFLWGLGANTQGDIFCFQVRKKKIDE